MRGISVALLLILTTFAGCIEDDDVEPVPVDDEKGDSSTGRIVGKVLRDDFETVVEGEVYLIFEDELVDDTLTDDEGMYAFEDLEPGDYRVRVTDPCCEDDLQRVRVTAGATTEHNPQLVYIPPVETWVDTSGQWTGFVGCNLHLFGQPWSCPDENTDTEHRFTVEPGIKSIVVWMEWETTPFSTSPDMRHWLHIPADESRAAVRHDETSPIDYRVDHTDEITLSFDEIEEATELRFQIWGSAQGMALTHQQPFTVHYHLFYGEPAPSGYTAQPDA